MLIISEHTTHCFFIIITIIIFDPFWNIGGLQKLSRHPNPWPVSHTVPTYMCIYYPEKMNSLTKPNSSEQQDQHHYDNKKKNAFGMK